MPHGEVLSSPLRSAPSQSRVARTYERIAPLYDVLDAPYEWSWKRRLRAELFARARGRLLDVGVGSGCNIPFYPEGVEVVGVDLSRRMLERTARRAAGGGRRVGLAQMNLLDLGFPDHAFDTVAATFVLLCLPDSLQRPALEELRRVCRPDGRILVLDYRESSNAALRALMRCWSPWLRFAFQGRYDASTECHLEAAGLRPVLRRTFARDSIVLLELCVAPRPAP